jgi:hypothetical protein
MLHRTNELLISPPAVEPITAAEAARSCRQSGDVDLDYFQGLITAARMTLENWCWSAFIQQTWQYWWDHFREKMFLPRGPVAVGFNPVVSPPNPLRPLQNTNCGGVSSLNYLLPQSVSEAPSSYVSLPPTAWETSQENQLPFIRMAYLRTFPVTRGYRDDVTAQVVCGYGPKPQDVPQPIRHAIKLMVSHLYANRGEVDAKLPSAIMHLIEPYRLREM